MFLVFFIASSCIQAPSNSRRSTTANNLTTTNPANPVKLPVFTQGNNYIQNGVVIYTSAVALDLSFADTLQLRGKDIDSYIRNNGTQTISCLTGRFNDSTLKQINIIAAMPRSVYNYTTQTLEYYYSLAPADEVSNKNFCQKSGLLNQLNYLYATTNPNLTYKLSALCPSNSCLSSVFTSQPLELYSQAGSPLTQIATKQLTYIITNRPITTSPIGQSCVNSSQCTSQGYDCCSLGQCVKDLALKPGVNQTTDLNYQQALQDILNNPNHIYNYPQYYFICSNVVNQPTSPATPSDPVTDAQNRLKNLTDLYNCTNKIEGEMGYCSITIANANVGTGLNSIYSAGSDDRSFSTTYSNISGTAKADLISIQEIRFGEVTLFNYDQIPDETVVGGNAGTSGNGDNIKYSNYLTFVAGLHNDNNSSGATIQVTQKPATAISNDLYIKYKVDASCVQVNTSVGKCQKYYIQGQSNSGGADIAQNRRGRVTDHYVSSNSFMLPSYADISKAITVQVDGVTQKQDIDWQLNTTANPKSIDFFPSSTGGLRVFDSQKVMITFFVDLTVSHVMDSKLSALSKIKSMCHCADLNCGLSPVKNTAGAIVDYSCVFPDPSPVTPPMSQKIYLSAKTVPVRYFDNAGLSVSAISGSTAPQEGTAFSYRKDNLLNPNNMPDSSNPGDNYIGFNEIYGSLTYANNSAKPAQEVAVTKDRTYDIYVDNGVYSNCIQCGNDYYSQLNKLFPLTQFGGGLVPLQSRTDRTLANGTRADDFAFGRACFVPATMIPWTHAIYTSPSDQRQNRMRAQHFLYANGYQHDWYGFDYGAVIGSFDGVKWFAIGSNRRIKASTNKLFIAVNGLFGDLTLESTYTVTINDGSLNPSGANMVTSDLQSDGAECQQFHQCNSDNDCATTLGWDYICSDVSNTTTSWPAFDDNAKEIPEGQAPDNRLTSILGISVNGKRCVYRGRGSACTQNYSQTNLDIITNINSTFNLAANQSMHTCSSNNYCQNIATGSTLNNNFNNRIARYGQVRTDTTSDSFGLGTKVPGRPMEFNAQEPMESINLKNFNSNKIAGICIPGRTPEADSFVLQNSSTPPSEYMGDRIVGIGMTYNRKTTEQNSNYLLGCSVMNSTNDYHYAKDDPNAAFTTDQKQDAATQSISTNALYMFKTIFDTKSLAFPIYSSNSAPISTQTYTENRCLRAPGASCFSDDDCAPSKTIANKIKLLSISDSVVTSVLNPYEVKFWQEELICSQSTAKSDPAYNPSNNRCCRDVGKTISLPSHDSNNNLDMFNAPGVDIPMSGATNKIRYSRVATVYKDQRNDTIGTNYPTLKVPIKDQATFDISTTPMANQFKTFSAYAERTSCSGDWVRNFASGNHLWDKARFQTFDLSMFKCMNWLPGTNGGTQWSCAGLGLNDPACQVIQTSSTSSKAKAIMDYLARLELMGIPQIALEAGEYFNQATEGDLSCRSNPNNQTYCYPGYSQAVCPGGTTAVYSYPNNLYNNTPSAYEFVDPNSSPPNLHLYSGVDPSNFQNMKQVFKADEVATCYPAGTVMQVGADPSLCCTGFINSQNNKCQLQDFVDISVYTNRYVSSEAKKLSANYINPKTGYVIDPYYVAQLACAKKMCASGKVAYGVLVSQLKIPGQADLTTTISRFLQGDTGTDDLSGSLTLFNQGLKLNTHAYCFPTGGTATPDMTVIPCGN